VFHVQVIAAQARVIRAAVAALTLLCLLLSPTLLSMHAAVRAANAVDVQPVAKKQKTAATVADNGTADVIRQSLLAADSRSQLRQQHDTSGPYTHLVLRDLVNDKLLRAVREEVIHNISATYKETDLFKVFQTGGWDTACNSIAVAEMQQQQQQHMKGSCQQGLNQLAACLFGCCMPHFIHASDSVWRPPVQHRYQLL
jgi:hypothetical protein